jgi:Glycosyl hydrolases family 39
MMKSLVVAGALVALGGVMTAQQPADDAVKITVNWSAGRNALKTTPTLQVVVNPLLRRGATIHDAAFANLKDLSADYVRYVPWHPYPRLAVVELKAPTRDKTYWDFSLIDPMTIDFLNATEDHQRILNFSTIPAWMYDAKKPVEVPADPDRVYWDYTQGHELRDPTCKELADYYSRLVSWYTLGGFIDELGVRHTSGYHFKIPYWEVFNEIDVEHQPTPQQYTASYDAVVGALHAIDPAMKFVGLALAFPERNPEMIEYFLNHHNHKQGIPLDMISYHFYASPTKEQMLEDWQYSFFDQADKFLVAVRFIEDIRKRLSPETRTTLDEVGSILPTDWHPDTPYDPGPPIPAMYWNASAALYAYVYLETAKMGIDVVGESQLVGFPSQFPSVTMLDWTTGAPNARFEVLRLLHDHLRKDAILVETKLIARDIDALAFEDNTGRHLLMVNKRDRRLKAELPEEFGQGSAWTVDSSHSTAKPEKLSGRSLELAAFSVTVIDAKPQR